MPDGLATKGTEQMAESADGVGTVHEATDRRTYRDHGIYATHDEDFYRKHLGSLTGRKIWLCYHIYESSFGPDRPADETWWNVVAPIGAQGGTFFKTSRVHDGMTVWLWGGRHPDDTPLLTANEQAHRRNYERQMAALSRGR